MHKYRKICHLNVTEFQDDHLVLNNWGAVHWESLFLPNSALLIYLEFYLDLKSSELSSVHDHMFIAVVIVQVLYRQSP